MEALLACLLGLMFSAGLYLMLSGILIRFVFGLVMINNAVNLLIFTAGGLTYSDPPLIPEGQSMLSTPVSNPLPQALILTAIVIGFSMVTFTLLLIYRTYIQTGILDTDEAAFRREIPEDPPDSSSEHKDAEDEPE